MSSRSGTRRNRRRIALAAIAAITALGTLALAPGASAGPLVASANGCAVDPLEKPFLRWLDVADYVLLPGGTFEGGAGGWSLDGAGVVPGNEPYNVHGAGEVSSLSIPAGGSATSGTMCVGLEEPTLRLFVKSNSASLLSSLKVEVLYENSLGVIETLPIGSVPALTSTSWTPHLPMVIGANLLPLIGDKTPVRFRFTPRGSSGWKIDDVYVDPRRH